MQGASIAGVKPYVLQYSPQSPSKNDETDIQFYPFKVGSAFVRYGRLGELNDTVRKHVQEAQAEDLDIPFVFAVSGHGIKQNGRFFTVELPDTPVLWTAKRLWEGFQEWDGLKALLKPLIEQGRLIILLFTQCYGEKLANRFKHADLPPNVIPVGLSNSRTLRGHNQNADTVGTEWIHWHYTVWLQTFQQNGSSKEALEPAKEAVKMLSAAIARRRTETIGLLTYTPGAYDEDDLDFDEEEEQRFLAAAGNVEEYSN